MQILLIRSGWKGQEIDTPLYPLKYLSEYGIEIIDGFNVAALQEVLAGSVDNVGKTLQNSDDKKIL